MNEEPSHTDEILQELRHIRRSIRRAAYIVAGGMILSTLIAAGFFASGGDIGEFVSNALIATFAVAIVWSLVVVVGATLSRLSKNRIDRERKVTLSGRASRSLPINQ